MYEIALKGQRDSIQVSYATKEKIEAVLTDSTINSDHILKIEGNIIRKGDIRGVFKIKEGNTSENKLNTHKVNQLCADLNQISWCIFLKDISLNERTNLAPWKLFYFSAFKEEMSDEKLIQMRELEKQYFANNPEKVFIRFDKRIENIFSMQNTKHKHAHVSNGFLEACKNILGGYMRTLNWYEPKTSENLRGMWENKYKEYVDLKGDRRELHIKHKKI